MGLRGSEGDAVGEGREDTETRLGREDAENGARTVDAGDGERVEDVVATAYPAVAGRMVHPALRKPRARSVEQDPPYQYPCAWGV